MFNLHNKKHMKKIQKERTKRILQSEAKKYRLQNLFK